MPTVTIRIQNDLPAPLRVSGVLVEFYNLASVFQTSGTTDANGEVAVSLPVTEYNVFMYKAGVSISPRQPQRIAVLEAPSSNIFLVTAHVRALPESSNPLFCRVSGFLLRADGKQTKTRLVVSPTLSLLVLDGNIIAPESRAEIASNDAGYFEFDLLRDVKYNVYFIYQDELFGVEQGKLDVRVPAQPGIQIDKLLFPLPANLSFSEGTIALVAGGAANLAITYITTFTDGSVRAAGLPWSYVKVNSSNTGVVDAVLKDGKLWLTPKLPGTANVTAERIVSQNALWRPLPGFTTGTVVVTVT